MALLPREAFIWFPLINKNSAVRYQGKKLNDQRNIVEVTPPPFLNPKGQRPSLSPALLLPVSFCSQSSKTLMVKFGQLCSTLWFKTSFIVRLGNIRMQSKYNSHEAALQRTQSGSHGPMLWDPDPDTEVVQISALSYTEGTDIKMRPYFMLSFYFMTRSQNVYMYMFIHKVDIVTLS